MTVITVIMLELILTLWIHDSLLLNVVMLVPTGIGCEIGGHAGDAGPAARLLATVCDRLILHPNVVNGSDLNEMPENALYVAEIVNWRVQKLLLHPDRAQTRTSN